VTANAAFDAVEDPGVTGAHANAHSVTILKQDRLWFPWWNRSNAKPGSRMIAWATFLLFVLAAGLLAVSLNAQYHYVLNQRHVAVPSVIEATALDVGMMIFSLLALGLARAGKSARVERLLIIACALASAVMNYAAADVTSARSVLAFVMPPIFLAVVIDRVVAVIRRYVLAERERSPWAELGKGLDRVSRVAGVVIMYSLRFVLAPVSTPRGLRQVVLNATPLPEPPVKAEIEPLSAPETPAPVLPPRWNLLPPFDAPRPAEGPSCPLPAAPAPRALPAAKRTPATRRKPGTKAVSAKARAPQQGTKTARLIELATERDDLAAIDISKVSKLATELAGQIGMNPASARRALLNHVRRLQGIEG
jgi:hypothetical protein